MVTLQDVLKTNLFELTAYASFQQYVTNPNNGIFITEEIGRSMAESLKFDYDNLKALNHLHLAVCVGMPSCYTEINVTAQGFMMNDLEEVRELFSPILDDKTVIALYEHGLDMRRQHEQSWSARRFVDMAIYLHNTRSDHLDDRTSTCIGFPGMPNMDPLIAQAIEVAQQHMFVNGNYLTELVPVGYTQYLYRCVPDTSSNGNVIMATDSGTVYLSGRPQRGETNSNHLRPV